VQEDGRYRYMSNGVQDDGRFAGLDGRFLAAVDVLGIATLPATWFAYSGRHSAPAAYLVDHAAGLLRTIPSGR